MTTNEDMNLDYKAAKAAADLFHAVHKKPCKGKPPTVEPAVADNLFTKALGVVQESGPFACSLYLLYRSGQTTSLSEATAEEVVACYTLATLVGLPHENSFSDVQKPWNAAISPEEVSGKKKDILNHMLDVSNVELERLLLIKQVWEQTLTYARYIARSRREKKERR